MAEREERESGGGVMRGWLKGTDETHRVKSEARRGGS